MMITQIVRRRISTPHFFFTPDVLAWEFRLSVLCPVISRVGSG